MTRSEAVSIRRKGEVTVSYIVHDPTCPHYGWVKELETPEPTCRCHSKLKGYCNQWS